MTSFTRKVLFNSSGLATSSVSQENRNLCAVQCKLITSAFNCPITNKNDDNKYGCAFASDNDDDTPAMAATSASDDDGGDHATDDGENYANRRCPQLRQRMTVMITQTNGGDECISRCRLQLRQQMTTTTTM